MAMKTEIPVQKSAQEESATVTSWVTLGITRAIAGESIFVQRQPLFLPWSPTEQFKMTSSPDITIKTRDSAGNLENLSNSEDIPAVVLSTGKNGYWSWTLGQTTQNPDSSSANDDEDTNASSTADGKTFVSHTPTSPDYVAGEFDDLVSWISPNILFNRMVAAGRLP